MNRREFLEVLAAASAGGFPLAGRGATARNASKVYDVPRFGNVHLLHFTDCHGQLLPTYFREPSVNLGLGDAAGHPPHLVSEAFLRHFGVAPGSAARTPSPREDSSPPQGPMARLAASATSPPLASRWRRGVRPACLSA